jgi:hypothetical protein
MRCEKKQPRAARKLAIFLLEKRLDVKESEESVGGSIC